MVESMYVGSGIVLAVYPGKLVFYEVIQNKFHCFIASHSVSHVG